MENFKIIKCDKTEHCTLVSLEDFDFIKSNKLSLYYWKGGSKSIGGYICCRYNKKSRYLHDIIMRKKEEKSNNKLSVDHINRDKLDNRRENLKWATQSEQNKNSGKQNRSKTPQPLPEGITQDMLPIYITYNKECYNKEKNLWREFFRIEKHPKSKKQISSSKSCKISIQDKLQEIKDKLYNLN